MPLDAPSPGPRTIPANAQVTAANVRGLTLLVPEHVPAGTVVEFDLLLGARPLTLMGRVLSCTNTTGGEKLELEFLALAQLDRDTLADFLQAVGTDVLRIRPPQTD